VEQFLEAYGDIRDSTRVEDDWRSMTVVMLPRQWVFDKGSRKCSFWSSNFEGTSPLFAFCATPSDTQL
jgi:hypothetical protein